MKSPNDLLDSKLSDTDGLSIEDRILRLELHAQLVMDQNEKQTELILSTIDQLNELREQLLSFMKNFVEGDDQKQSSDSSWWI